MVTQNPVRVLAYGYESTEQIDYPFGAGCYYAQRWREITEVFFTEYVLSDDGLYREHPVSQGYTIDEIAEIVYYYYKSTVDDESNQMTAEEEIDFLKLEKDFSGSLEDTAWITFWAYTIRNMEKERHEQSTRQVAENS
ncbi:hypothetical protein DQT32_03605 [Salmonella enterica subsp. enterica serovar Braenderup]|nr:hypothetical protein [Salmonella enterica subsp. enterica serovar Braenderup]